MNKNTQMETGIKSGYFLALDHITKTLEQRVKIQDEILSKIATANQNDPRIQLVTARKLTLYGILQTLDDHHEKMTKFFNFEEGGIK